MYVNKLWIAFIVILLVALIVADGASEFLGDVSAPIIQQLNVILDLYMPS
ncbi:MAG: hypothetical protein PVI43_07335 [Candidatus Bathyarchaeota archaeon]|jgi:hypothetical protein